MFSRMVIFHNLVDTYAPKQYLLCCTATSLGNNKYFDSMKDTNFVWNLINCILLYFSFKNSKPSSVDTKATAISKKRFASIVAITFYTNKQEQFQATTVATTPTRESDIDFK